MRHWLSKFPHAFSATVIMSVSLFSLHTFAAPVAEKFEIFNPELKKSVDTCLHEVSRLKRLACYDQVFGLPMLNDAGGKVRGKTAGVATRLGIRRQARRKTGFIRTQKNDENVYDGIWLTASATNRPSSILMFSCLENISRVELIFSSPLSQSNAQITLRHHQGRKTSGWQSDEAGLILRASRGLESIDMMQFIASSSEVTLRSDVPEINGLVFNTQGLSKDLRILRTACHW